MENTSFFVGFLVMWVLTETNKLTLQQNLLLTYLSSERLVPRINSLCHKEWQDVRSKQTSNKLFEVKPIIGNTTCPGHLGQRENTIINRLRIGHTRVTCRHLLSGDTPPLCDECNCVLTIKHILLECSAFNDIRKKYFPCSPLSNFFESTDLLRVVSFMKQINL